MGVSNTIHVSGFPRETRARDMAPDFESAGKVVRIDIPPMRSFQDRPYAFVQYETPEDCERAIERLNGKAVALDSRFSYNIQLARSRPYPSSYSAHVGRGVRGALRGGMMAGFSERGYQGRNYRDMDPRDSRGVRGPYRDGGRHRNWREYGAREPRDYRDREPLRAYERVRTVGSCHEAGGAPPVHGPSVTGEQEEVRASPREDVTGSAALEGAVNEDNARRRSLGHDESRNYSTAGNDGKTAVSDIDTNGSKELDNREPNVKGKGAENTVAPEGSLTAEGISSENNHTPSSDVEEGDKNTHDTTVHMGVHEEDVSSK